MLAIWVIKKNQILILLHVTNIMLVLFGRHLTCSCVCVVASPKTPAR